MIIIAINDELWCDVYGLWFCIKGDLVYPGRSCSNGKRTDLAHRSWNSLQIQCHDSEECFFLLLWLQWRISFGYTHCAVQSQLTSCTTLVYRPNKEVEPEYTGKRYHTDEKVEGRNTLYCFTNVLQGPVHGRWLPGVRTRSCREIWQMTRTALRRRPSGCAPPSPR
jgi:hypothetical protein